MSKQLVYFLRPKGRKGPIKIGCSCTPATRLETFAAWSPWPLEVMGWVVGNYTDEQFLHRCFAESHQHREWFKASPHVLEIIAKILAAKTIDAVRGEISPQGTIRKATRRERTDNERLRFSYTARVRHCEQRSRKKQAAWHAPGDVTHIMSHWRGFTYWDHEKRNWEVVVSSIPTIQQIARLEEYLADPAEHSIVPDFSSPRKPSICIPIFELEPAL